MLSSLQLRDASLVNFVAISNEGSDPSSTEADKQAEFGFAFSPKGMREGSCLVFFCRAKFESKNPAQDITSQNQEPHFHHFIAESEGVFVLPLGLAPGVIDSGLLVNAASVLLGHLRGVVYQVTAAFKQGAISIPCLAVEEVILPHVEDYQPLIDWVKAELTEPQEKECAQDEKDDPD